MKSVNPWPSIMGGYDVRDRDHATGADVGDLRAAAGQSRDVKAARRMLALALEGADRTRAAETCGMDRQTLRGQEGQETVRRTVSPPNGHPYNAGGLAGLSDRWKGVRVPCLAPARMADLGAFGQCRAGPCEGRGGALAQAGFAAPDCRGLRGRGA